MRNKQSKQLFKAALCVIVSIFGIIFTFHNGGNGEKVEKEVEVSSEDIEKYNFMQEKLPDYENESEDETYSDRREGKVYFTNTKKLDSSSFPLAAHAILCQETQNYLYGIGFEDVEEIKINDNEFKDNKEVVKFQCNLPKHEEVLVVTYEKKERKLKFEIEVTERIDTEK